MSDDSPAAEGVSTDSKNLAVICNVLTIFFGFNSWLDFLLAENG